MGSGITGQGKTGGAVGGANSSGFAGPSGVVSGVGGAVPSATEDIIKLQEKMIKQQNRCVSYSF